MTAFAGVEGGRDLPPVQFPELGIQAGCLGGTWTWNGFTWTKRHPATSPDARGGASMAYDAATGTVVLFGGVLSDGTGVYDDTWTWGSK